MSHAENWKYAKIKPKLEALRPCRPVNDALTAPNSSLPSLIRIKGLIAGIRFRIGLGQAGFDR